MPPASSAFERPRPRGAEVPCAPAAPDGAMKRVGMFNVMHFAVLGSGLSGSLAALMVAEAGHDVDLYDANPAPLMGASRNCEGKLHLGFVYAMDRSRRTVGTMIRGALTFRPILSRFVETSVIDAAVSDPFVYAVPADSMLTAEAIEAHFEAVAEMLEFLGEGIGADYPGGEGGPVWELMAEEERARHFDGHAILSAYRTIERAIDPAPLAARLAEALRQAPRITLRMGCRVRRVAETSRGFEVHCEGGEVARYGRVVNAAWEGRLALDRAVLPPPRRPVLHRFKAGFFADTGGREEAPPSVTFVTGPYGDFVKYPGRVYASWYPACLLRQERALEPERPAPDVADDSAVLLAETRRGLARLMPGMEDYARTIEGWRPVGGYITSWGTEGIEDPASELHERYRIGAHGTATYQSIDTGKFTTAPLFAERATARLMGTA